MTNNDNNNDVAVNANNTNDCGGVEAEYDGEIEDGEEQNDISYDDADDLDEFVFRNDGVSWRDVFGENRPFSRIIHPSVTTIPYCEFRNCTTVFEVVFPPAAVYCFFCRLQIETDRTEIVTRLCELAPSQKFTGVGQGSRNTSVRRLHRIFSRISIGLASGSYMVARLCNT